MILELAMDFLDMIPTKEELDKFGLTKIKILCIIERVKRQPPE